MKIEKEKFMIPAVTAIVVKETDGVKYLLLQERWKNNPLEDGLLEIPGGKISEYENIFDSLRREVMEETGYFVKKIYGEENSTFVEFNGYKVLNYEAFASAQNLEKNYPIMTQFFICEVEGEKLEKTNETQNIKWFSLAEVSLLINKSPEKFYPMHINAIRKYLADNSNFIF